MEQIIPNNAPLFVQLAMAVAGEDKAMAGQLVPIAKAKLSAGMSEAEVRRELEEAKALGSDGLKALARTGKGTQKIVIPYGHIRMEKARKNPRTPAEENWEQDAKAGKLTLEGLAYAAECKYPELGQYLAEDIKGIPKSQVAYQLLVADNGPLLNTYLQRVRDPELNKRMLFLSVASKRKEVFDTLLPNKMLLKTVAQAGYLAMQHGCCEMLTALGTRSGKHFKDISKSWVDNVKSPEMQSAINTAAVTCGEKLPFKIKAQDGWSYMPSGVSGKREGFEESDFHKVSELIGSEGYAREISNKYAYTFMRVMGSLADVMDYMGKNTTREKQPLHDCISAVSLPENIKDPAGWKRAMLKHGRLATEFLGFADAVDKVPDTLVALKLIVAELKYPRGSEHPELAAICTVFNISSDDFNTALDLVKKYQAKERKPSELPELVAEHKNLKFSKLPDGDVRGLFLGSYTHCCQKIGGVCESGTIHGYTSTKGGFYVVTENDEIIGQCWAWVGKKNEICFDSLEYSKHDGCLDAKIWDSLLAQCVPQIDKAGFSALTVGVGGRTPRLTHISAKTAEPVDYGVSSYRDSGTQYRIWEADGKKKSKKNVHAGLDMEDMLGEVDAALDL